MILLSIIDIIISTLLIIVLGIPILILYCIAYGIIRFFEWLFQIQN